MRPNPMLRIPPPAKYPLRLRPRTIITPDRNRPPSPANFRAFSVTV